MSTPDFNTMFANQQAAAGNPTPAPAVPDLGPDPYGVPDEMSEAYKEAQKSDFSLTVPEWAQSRLEPDPARPGENRLKSATWTELFTIEGLELVTDPAKVFNSPPANEGIFMIVLTLRVDSMSVGPNGQPSPNAGRKVFVRIRYNMGAWIADPTSDKGHSKMTQVSFKTFGSLLRALGYDDATVDQLNRRAAAFVQRYATEMQGVKVQGVVNHSLNEYQGKTGYQDDVQTFVSRQP